MASGTAASSTEKEAAMKRGVADGKEGEGQYVPKQGITIRQG
jgi:hypothetical protein